MQPGSNKLVRFLLNWVINTIAVLVTVEIVPGIHCQSNTDLVVAALLLGILNAFVRPILMLLALPLLIFTLGLFMFVINALLLELIGWLMYPHFYVDRFLYAFLGALVISITATILNLLTGNSRVTVQRNPRPPDTKGPGGDGPVIDV